jgi:hypothetical protein
VATSSQTADVERTPPWLVQLQELAEGLRDRYLVADQIDAPCLELIHGDGVSDRHSDGMVGRLRLINWSDCS